MTNATPLERRYVLDLVEQGDVVRAQVIQHGQGGLARIGLRRPAHEAPRLAGLLYSLCPRAQSVAALRALEQAAGVMLPPGQVAAREAVLLAEGLAAAVWRMAVTWPTLIGMEVDPAPVRSARAAAQVVLHGLFEEDWARPGGAPLRLGHDELRGAVEALFQALRAAEASAAAVIAQAGKITLWSGESCCLLGNGIFTGDLCPDCSGHEETPRALVAPGEMTETLAPWFDAQLSHSFALVAALRRALERVAPDAPVPFPDDVTGHGLGVAMTARGRLRHGLSLENGIITAWSTAAPTDWNFAPDGPVAAMARRLGGGPDLRARAQWLVAAFDPCAPCAVSVRVETAEASMRDPVHA